MFEAYHDVVDKRDGMLVIGVEASLVDDGAVSARHEVPYRFRNERVKIDRRLKDTSEPITSAIILIWVNDVVHKSMPARTLSRLVWHDHLVTCLQRNPIVF